MEKMLDYDKLSTCLNEAETVAEIRTKLESCRFASNIDFHNWAVKYGRVLCEKAEELERDLEELSRVLNEDPDVQRQLIEGAQNKRLKVLQKCLRYCQQAIDKAMGGMLAIEHMGAAAWAKDHGVRLPPKTGTLEEWRAEVHKLVARKCHHYLNEASFRIDECELPESEE